MIFTSYRFSAADVVCVRCRSFVRRVCLPNVNSRFQRGQMHKQIKSRAGERTCADLKARHDAFRPHPSPLSYPISRAATRHN